MQKFLLSILLAFIGFRVRLIFLFQISSTPEIHELIKIQECNINVYSSSSNFITTNLYERYHIPILTIP
jgi:hypothetical protein